jgi:hypothetical protein
MVELGECGAGMVEEGATGIGQLDAVPDRHTRGRNFYGWVSGSDRISSYPAMEYFSLPRLQTHAVQII